MKIKASPVPVEPTFGIAMTLTATEVRSILAACRETNSTMLFHHPAVVEFHEALRKATGLDEHWTMVQPPRSGQGQQTTFLR